MSKILVVDDEVGIRELLSEILEDEGHDVEQAEDAAAARSARVIGRPDLVLLDIWMPDTDGISLLKEWARNGYLTMPVIMMSGHATIDTAVEATRIGATDFLEKPVGMQKLLAAVKKALDKDARAAAAGLLLDDFPRSVPLRDLKKRLDQMLAKRPLVLLRSMPGSIIELAMSGLHGPGKSAIDLAHDSQPLGVDQLERIQGGVLWCEELMRLTRLQQKNLSFAADRLDRYALHLVLGTTHSPAELQAHGWDEGVLNRLFETTLGVPGLIELRDEVPELSVQLLARAVASGEVPLRRLSTPALNALRQHVWTGGYAELRGVVKSLALASLKEDIDEQDVRRLVTPNSQTEEGMSGIDAVVLDLPLREAREIFERMYFNFHLRHDGSNMTRLAERTGLERTHLYRKLKDLGLR